MPEKFIKSDFEQMVDAALGNLKIQMMKNPDKIPFIGQSRNISHSYNEDQEHPFEFSAGPWVTIISTFDNEEALVRSQVFADFVNKHPDISIKGPNDVKAEEVDGG